MSAGSVEQQLTIPGAPSAFDEAEIEGCDEQVRRYLCAAIAPGTQLARAARLRMRGSIKLGNRWMSFRSDELLAPLHGYYWPATVAHGLFRGWDQLAGGTASMSWKILGLVPVVRAGGPDVARSAMGRAAAEGIWLPTALLPRYGVEWRAEDDRRVVADMRCGDERVSLEIAIDGGGLVQSVHLDRWGDADGTGHFDWCPFGIDVAASHTFSCGITMPAEGTGGWFHGTDRWSDGEFFRYSISEMTLM